MPTSALYKSSDYLSASFQRFLPRTRTLQHGAITLGTAIVAYCALALLEAVLNVGNLAHAQTFSFDLGGDPDQEVPVAERAVHILALLTVISLAPSILVMLTSFTRIVVVLSMLRTAIGMQQSPPNAVLVSLALFLTAFIMAPVLNASYEQAVAPLIAGDMTPTEAFEVGIQPFRIFMMEHVRQDDLALFIDIAGATNPSSPEEVSLPTLIPAFMISELRRAFEIGFVIFVPFLVIDLVVASVLMSMGMMMLPPVIISLPFKIIFFVLVDGWLLVVGTLMQSFNVNLSG